MMPHDSGEEEHQCQPTAMRDAAEVLLEHERHVSPDVITSSLT
jgi:hypothetical protein